ncbi:MAG: MotA/TolQ/ExbB proton channel family protein [Planctomycetota bacterium]|jgi:biopolymer transport protein ExbB
MVWEFIQTGGWPMAPILLCSVISLALLLERSWFWLVLFYHRNHALRERILRLSFKPEEGEESKDPFCKVLYRLTESPDDPTPAVTLADRIVRETRSTVPAIHMIAAVSTSLGLLGTVVGVALAFQRSSSGSPQMNELASALSVALNTTILGLLVYVPAFLGATMNQMASNRLSFQLEQGLNTMQSTLRASQAHEVDA